MEVLFILLPLALIIAGVALAVFFNSVKKGQFDDLDTPPMRMLLDEDQIPTEKPQKQKKITSN